MSLINEISKAYDNIKKETQNPQLDINNYIVRIVSIIYDINDAKERTQEQLNIMSDNPIAYTSLIPERQNEIKILNGYIIELTKLKTLAENKLKIICFACTFENKQNLKNCEMCGTSLQPQSKSKSQPQPPPHQQPQPQLQPHLQSYRHTQLRPRQQSQPEPQPKAQPQHGLRPKTQPQPQPHIQSLLQPESHIIYINPQKGNSICAPSSTAIALLIMERYFINNIPFDKKELTNIIHDDTVQSAITDIGNENADDIYGLIERFNKLKGNENIYDRLQILKYDQYADPFQIGMREVSINGDPSIYIENMKKIINGILINLPLQSVVSMVTSGKGIAFARVNDIYIYVNTHGDYTSRITDGGRGMIIITSNIQYLLDNIQYMFNILLIAYRASHTNMKPDNLKKLSQSEKKIAEAGKNITHTIQYCVHVYNTLRGGYITNKQKWIQLKYSKCDNI